MTLRRSVVSFAMNVPVPQAEGLAVCCSKLVEPSVRRTVVIFCLYYSLQRQLLFFKLFFYFVVLIFPLVTFFIKFLLLLVECIQLESTPVIIDLLLIMYERSLISYFLLSRILVLKEWSAKLLLTCCLCIVKLDFLCRN
jgi:hypothetical protein